MKISCRTIPVMSVHCRSLPGYPQEIWLRTQHERAWRRLRVLLTVVGEIGWWGPDDYTNPHAR